MSQQARNSSKTRVKTVWVCILAVFAAAYLFCLPRDIFRDTPYSTVVTSQEGELLGARIASDGQWRFPPSENVP